MPINKDIVAIPEEGGPSSPVRTSRIMSDTPANAHSWTSVRVGTHRTEPDSLNQRSLSGVHVAFGVAEICDVRASVLRLFGGNVVGACVANDRMGSTLDGCSRRLAKCHGATRCEARYHEQGRIAHSHDYSPTFSVRFNLAAADRSITRQHNLWAERLWDGDRGRFPSAEPRCTTRTHAAT